MSHCSALRKNGDYGALTEQADEKCIDEHAPADDSAGTPAGSTVPHTKPMFPELRRVIG